MSRLRELLSQGLTLLERSLSGCTQCRPMQLPNCSSWAALRAVSSSTHTALPRIAWRALGWRRTSSCRPSAEVLPDRNQFDILLSSGNGFARWLSRQSMCAPRSILMEGGPCRFSAPME